MGAWAARRSSSLCTGLAMAAWKPLWSARGSDAGGVNRPGAGCPDKGPATSLRSLVAQRLPEHLACRVESAPNAEGLIAVAGPTLRLGVLLLFKSDSFAASHFWLLSFGKPAGQGSPGLGGAAAKASLGGLSLACPFSVVPAAAVTVSAP